MSKEHHKLNHFARIIVKELSKPVTLENKLFGEIMGGVIYNISADYYEIDIYYEPKSLDDIFKICEIVSEIYLNVMGNNKDEQDEQKQSSSSNLEVLISGFEDVGKKLAIATLKILRASHSDESWDYRCQKKKYGYSAIVFLHENKGNIDTYLSKKIDDDKLPKNKNKKELEMSLKLINDLTKTYTDHNILYVYIPKIEAVSNKKTLAECDFMLLVYNLSKRCLNIHVAEIKSGKQSVIKDQLKRYCKYFLVSDTDELTRVLENNKDKVISKKIRINVKTTGSKSKLISKTIKCKDF